MVVDFDEIANSIGNQYIDNNNYNNKVEVKNVININMCEIMTNEHRRLRRNSTF